MNRRQPLKRHWLAAAHRKHGALSPGYADWHRGAEVCCDATTRLPFTPMKPASLPEPPASGHAAAIRQLLAGKHPEDIWTARRGPSHAMVKNP